MNTLVRRVAKCGAVALASVMLASCAATAPKQDASEAVVKQRAQARWDAMVAGDLEKAYGYVSPSGREVISMELFRNSIRTGFWKSAEVTRVSCEGESCEVHVKVAYVYRGSTIETPSRETWVKEGGAWWHVFKPT